MSDIKMIVLEYCTGCGLCHSVCDVPFVGKKDGFMRPDINSESAMEFCKKVCPSYASKDANCDKDWGMVKGAWVGHAADENIRYKASSGGVVTALSVYMLTQGLVDGILHIAADEEKPWTTRLVCSMTREEVISHCGSRYAPSSPLIHLLDFIGTSKKYALVGKPCDIEAYKNYERLNPRASESIAYTISFFCAGVSGIQAQRRLLEKLSVDENSCKSLTYRGNGWPGLTTAVNCEGVATQITYNEAWGSILGRDIQKICRVCLDGIGLYADIACGDAWYLKDGQKPDFSEHDGRNIVFARSDVGEQLLQDARDGGSIVLVAYDTHELKYSQKYQYERRKTMFAKMLALKLFRKPCPNYQFGLLKRVAMRYDIKQQIKVFRGTAKRILERKI